MPFAHRQSEVLTERRCLWAWVPIAEMPHCIRCKDPAIQTKCHILLMHCWSHVKEAFGSPQVHNILQKPHRVAKWPGICTFVCAKQPQTNIRHSMRSNPKTQITPMRVVGSSVGE